MEREKLIEAAKMLKEHCKKRDEFCLCNACIFYDAEACECRIYNFPDRWDLSEVQDDD